MVGSSTYKTKRKKNRVKVQSSVVGRKKNCRKQLKSQETTKRGETKIIKAEQETKEKLDRSASNARRRCRSGTPGDAREVPSEHFQKKDPSKSMQQW